MLLYYAVYPSEVIVYSYDRPGILTFTVTTLTYHDGAQLLPKNLVRLQEFS